MVYGFGLDEDESFQDYVSEFAAYSDYDRQDSDYPTEVGEVLA